MLHDVTVVVRGAGERTETLCLDMIRAQGVPADHIVLLHEAPFSLAVRKTFEIGLSHGRKWTLCNDADVLLRPGSIEAMVDAAEAQPANVCEVQGWILDKFFGGPRKGGVHLYRTALLQQALACIPEEGTDVRPEHHTLNAMKVQGYPWVNVHVLVGLHDYEQYNVDIFRKCFVQAHKHSHYTQLFLGVWREGASQDHDFDVALKGYAGGIAYCGTVLIDRRQTAYRIAYDSYGIGEKCDLAAPYPALADVEAGIKGWTPSDAYLHYYPRVMQIEGLYVKPAKVSGPTRWGWALPKMLRPSVKRLGGLFCQLGERFKQFADN